MKNAEASSTAKVIAAATILLASEKNQTSLIAPEAASWCVEFLTTSARDRLLAWSAKHAITRKFWRLVEKVTLPGIIEHYAWRKRWIETLCRQAIADGCEQVVVIGAGFDTLALRLAREFPHVTFVEIDHLATSKIKWQALKNRNHILPGNLKTIAIDLAKEPLPDVSCGAKFSLWIIEGMLMYLDASAVDLLLAQIAATTEKRQVLFTYMRMWEKATSGFRRQSRLIDAWLSWRGEPFLWSLEPEAMEEFLRERGFILHRMIDPTDEGRKLSGENLVLCEVSLGANV